VTAIAYLRKSVARPGTASVSWDVQESAVGAMASAHGDDALTILSDWGKSGRRDRTKRSGYDTLLRAIEDGSCTAVYGYSLSRMARSVPQLSGLFELCRSKGVPIRLHVDHIDTSTASGMMMANILAAIAQFEADIASERTTDAHAVRKARGDRIGDVPYGQKPGEDAAAVVRALEDAGSFTGAARLLNAAGVPTRFGGVWHAPSVRIVVQREAPHLIPRNAAARTRTKGTFALSRLVKCPTCGTFLTPKVSQGKYTRYSCHRGSIVPHARHSVIDRVLIDAAKVEAARLRTPDRLEQVARDEREAGVIAQRRERLETMSVNDEISPGGYRTQKARLDAQEAALAARSVVVDIPAIDWDGEAGGLNHVLRSLWDEITLDPTTFAPVGFKWAPGLEDWIE
jgi:DNA invertase Pin-like site-specific DNA recombinase